MKKHIYEILLTSDFVEENEWLKFILEISRLNGRFRKWRIYVRIEKNIIKYYIVTKREIPTTINSSGSFLIKSIKKFDRIKTNLQFLYLVTNNENNIIDIYNKNESKFRQYLKQVEIQIRPYNLYNYLTKSKLYFEHYKGRKSKARAFFFIPHSSLSVNFLKHTRFAYKKEGTKYLQIQKSIDIFEKEPKKGNLIEINAFPYTQEKNYLNIHNYDFDKHSLIVGGSGTGKSKLISTLIKNIYEDTNLKEKYKIIVIDPHSSIEEDVGGIESSQIIDMKTKQTSANLWINSKENASSSTEITLTILKNIFGGEYNSKLERVLRHSIYFLIKTESLNFNNLRKLLTDTQYRNTLIRTSKDIEENIKEFFMTDFNEIKTNSYQQAISPIIALIDEMQMLPAFQNEQSDSIEKVIKENFLSIFSLNQAKLGEKVTKTISGLIFGLIFQLIQSKKIYKHIILIVDEVAVIENPILRSLLSEARKYNLSLILSQQYFGQVSQELQEAIFSNVMNYYTFRISREDAVILNNHLQMEMAVKNTVHNRIKLLTEIPNRDCIVRITKDGNLIPAFRCHTMNFLPIPKNKNQILSEMQNKNEISPKETKKAKFSLGNNIDLKTLMNSQSTGRRKMNFG